MDFLLGCDIGQSVDPTAIVLLSRERRGRQDYRFAVRLVEALPLGTPYELITHRLEEIVTAPECEGRITIAADRTGVGRAVVESMRQSPLLEDILWGITITGGRREVRDKKFAMDFSVPKKDLIGGILVALQKGNLIAHPRLTNLPLLKQQLLDFGYQVQTSGDTIFEGQKRTHDDLVLALGCALWLSDLIPFTEGFGPISGSRTTPEVLLPGRTPEPAMAPSWRAQHDQKAYRTTADGLVIGAARPQRR